MNLARTREQARTGALRLQIPTDSVAKHILNPISSGASWCASSARGEEARAVTSSMSATPKPRAAMNATYLGHSHTQCRESNICRADQSQMGGIYAHGWSARARAESVWCRTISVRETQNARARITKAVTEVVIRCMCDGALSGWCWPATVVWRGVRRMLPDGGGGKARLQSCAFLAWLCVAHAARSGAPALKLRSGASSSTKRTGPASCTSAPRST